MSVTASSSASRAPSLNAAALLKRARAASATELAGIPWLQVLAADEREAAQRDLRVVQVAAGDQDLVI